ncbi:MULTISPECIES: hypothetical protein [unclassified Symbiopectobacterium]|uniref:hypothetical protein n=1 Tax=unclassified Symbiopectobacterium TaxID=2794573 RepID=UPI0022263855|nr:MULTISPECIES: hypothetical protein [unclassified Symbiopectobacterium]MCW2474877.1 hypothetical protein [Candidatus Symbiopectobacterium sp. NZEC151]MCW2487395.1 hypothetical protein [Candidatus Symbiopectobacterium sp. NZEC127]
MNALPNFDTLILKKFKKQTHKPKIDSNKKKKKENEYHFNLISRIYLLPPDYRSIIRLHTGQTACAFDGNDWCYHGATSV